MKKQFTEGQIIEILKETQAGIRVADVCRKHQISDATYYNLNGNFRGMSVSEARQPKALEAESAKLSRLLADSLLDNALLNSAVIRKWKVRRPNTRRSAI